MENFEQKQTKATKMSPKQPSREENDLTADFTQSLRVESQRDCVTQPRVASSELPWVRFPTIHNPNGVAAVPQETINPSDPSGQYIFASIFLPKSPACNSGGGERVKWQKDGGKKMGWTHGKFLSLRASRLWGQLGAAMILSRHHSVASRFPPSFPLFASAEPVGFFPGVSIRVIRGQFGLVPLRLTSTN